MKTINSSGFFFILCTIFAGPMMVKPLFLPIIVSRRAFLIFSKPVISASFRIDNEANSMP